MFRRLGAGSGLLTLVVAVGCGGGAAKSPETEALHTKAYEAAIWATPILNSTQRRNELRKHGAKEGDLAVLGSRPNGRVELPTLNDTAPYVFGSGSLKGGPMVIDVPPASARARFSGGVMDVWNAPIEDFGPAGADAGKGGRFVLMPPGSTDSAPAGYTPLQSGSYEFHLWVRSVPARSGDDGWRDAVEYAKGLKVYPLANAGAPPPNNWFDVSRVKGYFHGTPTFGEHAFRLIDEYIQNEPGRESDRAMHATLAELGIVKGKPFTPEDETTQMLGRAAKAAEEHLRAELENGRMFERFWPERAWGTVTPAPFFTAGAARQAGPGETTLMASVDAQGQPLDGGKRYRLRVPPKVPAKEFWTVILYSTRTRAIVDTEKFSLSSRDRLQINKDGSIDLFFAPLAPAGRDANWLATRPGENFYAGVRFYGPTPPLAGKAWILGNFEEIEK
jgi:hypothetical protein